MVHMASHEKKEGKHSGIGLPSKNNINANDWYNVYIYLYLHGITTCPLSFINKNKNNIGPEKHVQMQQRCRPLNVIQKKK